MAKAKRMLIALYAVMAVLILSCTSTPTHCSVQHEPDTQKLIALMDEHPEMKDMLIKSIQLAKKVNPDTQTNPVQTLEDYYAFLDWAAKAMPWNINPNLQYPSLYRNIDQSMGYFYFIMDQPLPKLAGRGYYHNSLQYYEPFSQWLIEFTKNWGVYLSTPESWNDAYYQTAYNDELFGLKKGWYEDPANWHTFNDFFSRRLSSPLARPIANLEDDSVIVAPADSKPQGVWNIDEHSAVIGGTVIKSRAFNSIEELLANDETYKDAFANGILTHTFLDVNDYHRYHVPIGGTVKAVRLVPAQDAAGGIIVWNKELKQYQEFSETPGWQMIETRGYVIIQTEKYGLVALIAVGMSQVSSVNFEENIQVGTIDKKGDPLGYFLFGGSDFVMLFQEGTGFVMNAPRIPAETEEYAHILMGERYGQLTSPRP
jgi:phosphatidylserine decarboxylase precursor